MFMFVCAHGREAAVVGDVCWFFTPCLPCERDPLTIAAFVAEAHKVEGALALTS